MNKLSSTEVELKTSVVYKKACDQFKMNASTKFDNILISEKRESNGLKHMSFCFSKVIP